MVKATLEQLVSLQTYEDQERKLSVQLEAFPRKAEALDTTLNQGRVRLDAKAEQLRAAQKRYRSLEAASEDLSHQARQRKARLGTVKTNKEYQALLKEVDEFEARVSTIEDEMLGLLDEIEAEEAALAGEKQAFEAVERDIVAERADVEAEMMTVSDRLRSVTEEKRRLMAEISAKDLDLYQKIKSDAGLPVVAPVLGRACDACNMNLPPQFVNELRHTETLQYCPFCHRLIVYGELSFST